MPVQLGHILKRFGVLAKWLKVKPLVVPATQTGQIVHQALGCVYVQIGKLRRNATTEMANVIETAHQQALAVRVKAAKNV